MDESFILINRSIEDIKKGITLQYEDSFCVLSSRTSSIEQVIINNPFNLDDKERLQTIAVVGNTIAGIICHFSLLIKVNNELYNSRSASYLVVNEYFRKIFLIGIKLTENCYLQNSNFFISGGVSKYAMPIHKYFGAKEFIIPRYFFLINCKSLINGKLNLKGILLTIISFVINFLLFLRIILIKIYLKVRFYGLTVEELHHIPKEIESIVNKNPSRFQEYHNNKWFEWSLNNKFGDDENFKKHFFIVKDNTNSIIAFFFTYEKHYDRIKEFKNINIGSLMEWETSNSKILSEKCLILFALMSFHRKVDLVECATNDRSIIRLFKIIGMFRKGQRNMIVKPLLDVLPDEFIGFENIDNWRIRPAVGDTIMY